MSAPETQSSNAETSETTPLLNDEASIQDVEAQNASIFSRQYWTVQTFTTLSLVWCCISFIFGFALALWTAVSDVNYWYLTSYSSDYLAVGGYITFWTAIFSVLNYARLRKNGSELPWSVNLVIDLIVGLSGLYFGLLYIIVYIQGKDRCDRGYYAPPIEECHKYATIYRTLGLFMMIAVLALALTHFILLFLRVRTSPRGAASRDDGWFCGLGRGPLRTAVRPLPENQGTG